MSDIASTVADFRRAVSLLGEIDDPAAYRVAEVLRNWLAGEEFDRAAGLITTWRSHLRLSARDRALSRLVALHADLDDSTLAAWIVDGIARVPTTAVRPDGAEGCLFDLARSGPPLSQRHWRRLIRGHRGR